MAHEDWDLFAIVRSCKAATFAASTNTNTEPPPIPITPKFPSTTTSSFTVNQEINGPFAFPNLVQQRANGFQELHQLLMNFNPTTNTTNTITSTNTTTSALGINPNSPFSDVAGFIGQQQVQQSHHQYHHPVPIPTNYTSIGTPSTIMSFDRFQHQYQQQPQAQIPELPKRLQAPQTSPILSPKSQPQPPQSRKRKTQQKKMVCHVTADNISADLWAWRKYGQKPIKGSPYPRNYYRCSSCKGCAARKQVERSTTEPNMFVVTYTGDHKHPKPVHRNSLAGSTRSKTRLPETHHETGSCSKEENAAWSSTSAPSPMSFKSATPEAAAAEPHDQEVGTEPDATSENNDDAVLIPNMGFMSDVVLLGFT